ncbi:hypothetical protein PM082_003201 [Marasmius tenuissimus]|nr:hypothetical protein PM082_003201 [Marasmius tenuissimus]
MDGFPLSTAVHRVAHGPVQPLLVPTQKPRGATNRRCLRRTSAPLDRILDKSSSGGTGVTFGLGFFCDTAAVESTTSIRIICSKALFKPFAVLLSKRMAVKVNVAWIKIAHGSSTVRHRLYEDIRLSPAEPDNRAHLPF